MKNEQLAETIGKIAWAYILIHLHITFLVDFLPDWCGYLMILSALSILGILVPSALLLKTFAIILAIYHGIAWIPVVGSFVSVPVISILFSVVSLYFHFQLLTNIAEIARIKNCPQERTLLNIRTVRTIITTLFILPLPWNEYEVLAIFMVVVQLILVFWLCSTLFSLRRSLTELPEEPEEPEQIETETL